MRTRIRKLTIRVWVAMTTFVIGVALTTLWVVPRFTIEQPPAEVAISNLARQQEILVPAGWRQLEFNNKVLMMLPPNMQSVDLIGDFLRYTEGYNNGPVYLIIIGDFQLPEFKNKSRDKSLFTCDPSPILRNGPTYTESLIQVDGRQAKLTIIYTVEREIAASLCFPNADDSNYELLVTANCQDEQALETARQIFSSIRFKR